MKKRLYRSRNDKVIGGICGGLAEYTEVDVMFVRVLMVIVLILTGLFPIGIIYLAMWLIVPQKPVGKDDVIDV